MTNTNQRERYAAFHFRCQAPGCRYIVGGNLGGSELAWASAARHMLSSGHTLFTVEASE